MTVSDAVGEAGEQCSSSRLPLQDDSMEEEEEELHFSTKQPSSKASTDIVIDEESDIKKGEDYGIVLSLFLKLY